jgi:uncharacterized membrane protein YhaH (DUF805 family)
VTTQTPYQTPDSDINNPQSNNFDKTVFFSANQRIGRLRWLVFGAGAQIGMVAILFMIAALFTLIFGDDRINLGTSVIAMVIGVMLYMSSFALTIIFNNRRLHDVGKSGWFNLLILVPVLNLIFILYLLFAPGDKQSNRFGSPPAVNTVFLWIAGLLVTIVFIGIITSITLPAYNEYTARTENIQPSNNEE